MGRVSDIFGALPLGSPLALGAPSARFTPHYRAEPPTLKVAEPRTPSRLVDSSPSSSRPFRPRQPSLSCGSELLLCVSQPSEYVQNSQAPKRPRSPLAVRGRGPAVTPDYQQTILLVIVCFLLTPSPGFPSSPHRGSLAFPRKEERVHAAEISLFLGASCGVWRGLVLPRPQERLRDVCCQVHMWEVKAGETDGRSRVVLRASTCGWVTVTHSMPHSVALPVTCWASVALMTTNTPSSSPPARRCMALGQKKKRKTSTR